MSTSVLFLVTKYLATAGVVVLVSELAKRSDRVGALIASLPLVTVLTLIWLHVENQGATRVSNHAYYTFWYVLPTLPMFLLFPWLMAKTAFWPSLLISAVFTVGCFAVFALAMRRFGIDLL